jgi:general secretion pathway protein G
LYASSAPRIVRSAWRSSTSRCLTLTTSTIGMAVIATMPTSTEVTINSMSVKQREVELRQALRTIRGALDAYKAAADTGLLAKATGESGYPPSLEVLTQGLEIARARPAGNTDGGAAARLVFLRQLPRDPFHPDPLVPAAQTWSARSYASRPDDPHPGADVFDVASKSTRIALDGTPYSSW